MPAHKLDPSSDQWLSVDEAALLLGQSVRHLRRRCRLQWSMQGLAAMAPSRSGNSKPCWWVRRSADQRLTAYPKRPTRDQRARASLITQHPEHLVERAYRKAHWLQQWRTACETRQCATQGVTDRKLAETIVTQARLDDGDAIKISVRSLQVWWADYNVIAADGQIAGVGALVDRYSGPGNSRSRSPEAVEWFYDLYRCQNRLSIRVCHAATLRESRRRGWHWPAGGDPTAKWLQANDDRSLTFLLREGHDQWARRYLPHLEIDYTTVEPGEFYVCDHSQSDFFVVHDGKQFRPWFTAVQDCRTRAIVGWHLGVSPNQDAILSALRMAFGDWAIPKTMRIDNGKDFCSRVMTGETKRQRRLRIKELGRDGRNVLQREEQVVTCDDKRWSGIIPELGIDLIYATPYSPWSKGTLERWYGSMHDQFDKSFVTYCGNSAVTKPECLDQIRHGYTAATKRELRRLYGRDWKRRAVLKLIDNSDVPTLAEARQRMPDYLELYHRTAHRGDGMDGQSPLSVWNQAVHLRRAADNELLFLMDVRGSYKVGANGVRITIGSAAIGYGARCQELKRWVGREVLIAIDDRKLAVAWALDPKKRTLIAQLATNEKMPANATTEHAREAIKEIKREQAVFAAQHRGAAKRTRTAVGRIRENQREELEELRATGTEAGEPHLVPVRTGFEAVSKLDRNVATGTGALAITDDDIDVLFDADFDRAAIDLSQVDDVTDLLDDEATSNQESTDQAGVFDQLL